MHLWWTHWSCVTIVYYSQSLNYLLVQDGWTALHVACEKGHDEVVQTLMIAKADLNLQNNVSTSTVQLIIVSADDHRHKLEKHYDPLCAYIVCWRVTMHLQDGATALHIASQYGHVTTVKLLVEAGASLDVQGNVSWHQYISDIQQCPACLSSVLACAAGVECCMVCLSVCLSVNLFVC